VFSVTKGRPFQLKMAVTSPCL